MSEKDRSFVIRMLVIVLMICSLSVVFALLVGLFSPKVDNAMIFKILEPLSMQVTGAVISIVSGLIAIKVTKDRE